ncbi:hypothetical protein PQ478_08350 [Alkalihalophilus pseudofirmus]|uniref:hypothetical protein n=1 Tax=Alkalihalophilus pseudofirmus TaxID=79885 RepID=UPI00259AF864|nr:hypothetical protein [Alkalihalophilus pseudofirmus]WEG18479.1 hypothetical protein PQ478_08350 [Alkalihalophilus pseudofirmus]
MRLIKMNSKNEVISLRYGSSIVGGEIESETGEIGQIRLGDGTFINPEPKTVKYQETLEEKIERLERQIQQDNITNFEVLATIYEELLMKG